MQSFSQPRHRTALAVEFVLNDFSYVNHSATKKGGTIHCLSQSEVPPSTLYTNKHEQLTLHKWSRDLSAAYSRVLQIGGFQTVRIRAKAHIS